MDAKHLDRLSRALAESGTRRGLLGLLATLPILGGLLTFFDADEADARGRRHRRRGKRRKKCDSESRLQTCSGVCGPVKNNCKKTVDCGSCDCPEPCGECFTCQSGPNTPGTCVVEDDKACGSDRQVCRAGACVDCGNFGIPCCAGNFCAVADTLCVGGVCDNCGFFGEPCCAENSCIRADALCISGTCLPCGTSGKPCCLGNRCDDDTTCVEGTCVP